MADGIGGRPQANINWKEVEGLLEAGCSGREIASHIGINYHTLYDRCQTDHGLMFSEYSQYHQSKGESILRAHQYNKALGRTQEGDNTLLIWLGKTRLGQSDKDKTIETVSTKLTEITALLDQKRSPVKDGSQ